MSEDITFCWHDYETFGVDPRRDAPAQFAAVRTDAQLNQIGEPISVYCRPPRDALPHPKACLITGLTPQRCEAQGLIEAEFTRMLHAELSVPGTIGVGYNSIKFDDEVTRHLLWRNLIDPYGREWQNGCSRWDLLNVVRCVYALKPGALNWPRHPDGRHSLRLEDLSAANGLVHAQAHDALSDVRATLGLARLIRKAEPKLWNYCLGLRDKRTAGDVVGDPAVTRKPFLHVTGMVPQERGHLAIVVPLAWRPPKSMREIIVWDLAHDPEELLSLDVATIRQRLFTKQDELPPGVQRLPIKTIKLNQSPIVIKPVGTLTPERAVELGIDLAVQAEHARKADARSAALAAIDWTAVYASEFPEVELDAEQTLYGGPFLGDEDRRRLQQLPALDPQALAALRPSFEDPRLADLLLRYRARNWPGSLNDADSAAWLAHCRARLHQGKGGFLTLQRQQELIDELALEADERGQAILEALVDWAEAIAP